MGKGYAEPWVLPDASGIRPAMGNSNAHACRHRRKIR
jgi:hypothetical protein